MTEQEKRYFKYQEYKEQIFDISNERELDQFIKRISDDETLSFRRYEALRHRALDFYYNHYVCITSDYNGNTYECF